MIPSVSISSDQEAVESVPARKVASTGPSEHKLGGDVLIVEDNMVIALDASDILSANGAENVHMSSSVADALNVLEQNDISFALLDVNLGSQTSLPVAERLARDGKPFILATGYGDAGGVTEKYPPAIIVNKPFTAEALTTAISDCLSTRENGD